MRNYDLSPLYRSTVGFDRLSTLLDSVMSTNTNPNSYPPYNIEKTGDDSYLISIAVAGFTQGDLEIEARDGQLVIKGRKPDEKDERTYLHRGIASRAFEMRFELADHVRVTEAHMENGLLNVSAIREVPEALKPRKIEIAKSPSIEATVEV